MEAENTERRELAQKKKIAPQAREILRNPWGFA
jgi:hypothetical protein